MEFGRLANFIGGEWKESQSKEIWEVKNPALDEVVAEVPMSTREEVNEAVQAASEAFHEWRRVPPVSRARYLHRLIELLEEHFEDLSIVQTKEHGKTIDESRGETRRGIENCEVASGIPSLMMGESLQDIASGIDEYIIREPLGVFACIPPFNFPFMVPLWFLPYAIATGNTFIVKPSPNDPVSQVKLQELLDETDIPPGVVNLVHGGAEVASMLMEHQDIKGITFVGSTPIAKIVYKKCGETGKRVIAQGGAKNFLVIMPDCNLDQTIAALMTSFFGNTGQRCLSGATALVVGRDDAFYKKFVDTFTEAAFQIKVGYGLEEGIQMGPLQSKDKKKRVLGYIESGVAEGATLRLDGRNIKIEGDYPQTCFLNPSVFEGVTLDMKIGKEEIFGPVASIMRAETLDDALDLIHSVPFGNAASIFTSNGGWAREFEYRVQTGNVGINIGIVAPMAFFPFSGMKDSFFGTLHGQGKDAVRFFTESKVVVKRWF
ncbi:MAG: CoA-acylating methylmalonate-semialdehyde dehydrogenase [Deltaproteobacteria bacterium]|nr:CoA-acylating methylmalonate-semialdehyde dehydrogenase [Deltaproteobacteria bacterium]